MNLIDILSDSPNGHEIVANQPKKVDIEKVIRYYLDMLDQYFVQKYPVETGIINYTLGRVLFNDEKSKGEITARSKRIENALYYFNQALETFGQKDYPMMYSIINIYMAKLFRERSILTISRSFLADRSTPEESLQFGIDHALEALEILTRSKPHQAELAMCCLELGHLHLLQAEHPDHAEDVILKEQALTYLERVLAISKALPDSLMCIGAKGHVDRWRPDDPSSFPPHIRDFLEGFPFNFLDGAAYYFLARLEQGWGLIEFESGLNRADRVGQANPHHVLAFEHYCRCVRPRYLQQSNPLWSDAHHRVALLIIKHPVIVDPDFRSDNLQAVSDIYLDSAISHLQLALKCDKITKTNLTDIHFHLAQSLISKLQLIIDKVPYGESITKAIMASDGLDLIKLIDHNLNEALARVTAANTQSAQDAYLYFFACLKLAEYRMLEAACAPSLTMPEREVYLKDAIEYIIDACLSRPLADNMDLHYIATCQLGQVLMAVKRTHAGSKAYGKILFCLSALLNRSIFNISVFENKLRDDLYKHSTSGISAALKDTKWIKLHLGPTKLHERASPGYATWSFEDIPSNRHTLIKTDSEQILDVGSDDQPVVMTEAMRELDKNVNALVVVKATPPKGVPPLKLPIQNFKKVHLSGEDISDADIHKVTMVSGQYGSTVLGGSVNGNNTLATAHFKPPSGAVPLTALGHSIPEELLDNGDGMDRKKIEQEILEGKRVAISPYTQRLRSRVPPLEEMMSIDKANRVAYGFPKGKVVHLIPNKALRDSMKPKIKPQTEKPKKMGKKSCLLFVIVVLLF
jgi:tetratricopeptide (TPR) repeat protein